MSVNRRSVHGNVGKKHILKLEMVQKKAIRYHDANLCNNLAYKPRYKASTMIATHRYMYLYAYIYLCVIYIYV